MLRNHKFYQFEVKMQGVPVRKPHPGGEMERTGEVTDITVLFGIIAPNATTANILLQDRYRYNGAQCSWNLKSEHEIHAAQISLPY